MEIIKVKDKKTLENERKRYKKLETVTSTFSCIYCGKRYECCNCGKH